MTTAAAVLIGFVLDLLLGDPRWLPHPVVWMGRGVNRLEGWLRRCFPATKKGELWGGRILAAVLPLASFGISLGSLTSARMIHPLLGFALECVMCYQILAARELWRQSMLVYGPVRAGNLPAARTALSRIVGRDTAALDEEGVVRAAVETVAENASDGVAAPLVFLAVGGAPLGMLYKAINTMDSMVGYQNEKYRYFGRAAAKLDDAANLLPSRLCALCMAAAAPLAGLSRGGAWRIWRRDRRNHASPNAAQTEAACAGALCVRLGGSAVYFGERVCKQEIGDPLRAVEPEDIPRANRLMLVSSLLVLFLCILVRIAVCYLLAGR